MASSSGATNGLWGALRSFRKASTLPAAKTVGGPKARSYRIRGEAMGATVGEVATVSQRPVSQGETLAPDYGRQAGFLALALRGAVRDHYRG